MRIAPQNSVRMRLPQVIDAGPSRHTGSSRGRSMVHSTSRQRALFSAIATALALAAFAPATHAQDKPEVAGGLEDIVVTARKRAESVQETPVSMVAFSEESLKQASMDSFKDLGNSAPNIEINGGIPNGGGSATQIYIRGVGQDDYSFPNEPGVGLYVDDVYVARSAGGDFGFMDIERIEVLRGPQGTLYGRNTIGGAVKIITKKPDGTFDGAAGATVGSYSRLDAFARVQFPISDTLSGNFAVGKRTRDGLAKNFIGQDMGETNQSQVRAALRWQPGNGWEVNWRADGMRQRQAGPAGSMVAYVPNGTGSALINPVLAPAVAAQFNLRPPFNVYGPAWVKTLKKDGKGVYNGGGAEETRDWADVWGTSVTIDKEISETLSFKSVTAYRHSKVDIRRDSDQTPFKLVRVDNPDHTSQLTQEFQLLGQAFDNRLDYVVGLFGLQEKGSAYLYAPLLQGTFALIGLDLEALINSKYDASSVALFGEGTYKLTDRVALTVGGRFTKDDKEYVYGLRRPPSGAVPLPPKTLSNNWSEFLPKVGLEFQLSDTAMLFANASRGYKAGGYNSRALSGNPPKAYDPEFINAYELGFKTEWADRKLILNGAVFRNDYTDIQLLSVLDLGGGNVETVINNAAKGTITGGELELTALPTPNLKLGLGLGLLDTKYDRVDASAASAGILKGNEFINAPKFSANASAEYTIPAAWGEYLLHVDAVHRGSQFRDAVNTPQLKSEAYTLLNARATFTSASKAWEVAVFGTNLTDKIYLTNGVSVLGLEYIEAYYSRPREWGASVT
jgi:iron complex outermembrane receptor protein